MVTYLFVVDRYYSISHIPFGGSTCLCAFEFDVILNFICLDVAKLEYEILVQV